MKAKRRLLIAAQLVMAFIVTVSFINYMSFMGTGYSQKAEKRGFYSSQGYTRLLYEDAGIINEVVWANELFADKEKEIDLMYYLRNRTGELHSYVTSDDIRTLMPAITYKVGDIVKWIEENNSKVSNVLEVSKDSFVKNVNPTGKYKTFNEYIAGENIDSYEKIEVMEAINDAVEELAEDYKIYLKKNEVMSQIRKDFQYDITRKATGVSAYKSSAADDMVGKIKISVEDQEIYGNLDRIHPDYKMTIGVKHDLAKDGDYYKVKETFKSLNRVDKDKLFAIFIASLVVMLAILVLLAVDILKRKEDLKGFDKLKTEIACFIVLFAMSIPFGLGFSFMNDISGYIGLLNNSGFDEAIRNRGIVEIYSGIWIFKSFHEIQMLVAVLLLNVIALVGYISLFKRIAKNELWSNSLLKCILDALKNGKGIFDGVNAYGKDFVVKTGILLAANLFVPLVFTEVYYASGIGILIMIVIDVFYIRKYLVREKELEVLMNGIRKLKEGDLQKKIDSGSMITSVKNMAEELNDIGDGLEIAVEERIKSERMQTELITNVSHDIKTPLTSIIGYVDLIKKEDIQGERIKEYLEGLERTSNKLKVLMEDLIEVSKSGAGKMDLDMTELDFAEITKQLLGDWKDRFDKKKFELVLSLEEETSVMADGRATSRILDNIFSNVCKYALEGSRVYVDLRTANDADMAVLTVRNISANKIEQSADELLSRFVKGDSARSDQGNGLGLAIAGNLSELMGGDFKLTIDGDLFKVEISLKKA